MNINCTLFNNADAESVAKFFDTVKELGIDGITVSPGYAYERAPDQQHFLNREKTKQLFRDIFAPRPRRQGLVVQPVEPVPGFPRRQPELPLHALGQSRPARCSAGSGPAICSAKAMPRPSAS